MQLQSIPMARLPNQCIPSHLPPRNEGHSCGIGDDVERSIKIDIQRERERGAAQLVILARRDAADSAREGERRERRDRERERERERRKKRTNPSPN